MPFLKNISNHSAGDQELVILYKRSADLEILAALYQRYMELVYGVCLKYLPDPETAKDAVMIIFEELAQKLHKHEVENFRGWLYTLAKNHCLMQLRSSRRIKTGELDPDRMQMEQDVHLNGMLEKEEHLDKLSKCLETLSPEQRSTVELFYLQNRSYKEIEKLTGLEWNKVRSLIQNGRRNLKICMERSEKETVIK
ncbi:MAG TPA: sigma-70 family RNA polymerase sigma factor [Puia sp.]|nr:sigma-70 family RNA polymerase sigma factor [Puia sp.]